MSDTPEPPAPLLPPGVPSDILPVTIEEEMQSSYLAYAMSVIVSRALPETDRNRSIAGLAALLGSNNLVAAAFTHDELARTPLPAG